MSEEAMNGQGREVDPGPAYPAPSVTPERRSDDLRLRTSNAQLRLHYAIASILAASSTLAEAMPRVLETICAHLQWEAGAYWTEDHDRAVLRCNTFWHTPAINLDQFRALSRDVTFARGVGLPGRVWASGAPAVIADVAQDANFPRAARAAGLRGGVAFPIPIGDEIRGVIECFSQSPGDLDPDLVQALRTLGTQIGQFIARTRAEARRVSMLETSLDAIVSMDHRGNIVEWNPAATSLFGHERAAALGRELAALIIPPDLRDRHRAGLARYLATGEGPWIGRRIEVSAQRADGTQFPAELAITRVPFDGPPLFIGYIRDLSEWRRMEAARHELERRTRASLDALLAMAEAIVQAPDEGADSQHPTPAIARRLADLTLDVLGSRSITIVALSRDGALEPLDCAGLPPDQREQWRDRIANLPRAALSEALIARLRAGELALIDTHRPDYRALENPFGVERYLLAPMRVGASLVGLLAVDYGPDAAERDDTALIEGIAKLGALVIERERLQREREEARSSALALREANRRMDEFLGIAGHEMRTPLTSIKGNLQLAQRRLAQQRTAEAAADPAARGSGDVWKLLDRAEVQAGRLSRLVDDILDVSRIRAGQLEIRRRRCDLAEVVRESVDEQRALAPGREILLTGDGAPIMAHADPERIGQVVTNFLTNAIKYAPADRPITVGLAVDGATARVWVRDEGPGLAPREQERVWDLFYRSADVEHLHGSSVGLGLGLHISRTIIEQHGGRVGVVSAPGAGATFWFTLPLVSG